MAGCQLFSRTTSGTSKPTFNPATIVSCFRYGLDFVAMGTAIANTALGGTWSSSVKCVTQYLVNMDIIKSYDLGAVVRGVRGGGMCACGGGKSVHVG